MGYCDADDIKDLDMGLKFRQRIADYINNVVRQAQSDAWEEGFERGYYMASSDKSSVGNELKNMMNPYNKE